MYKINAILILIFYLLTLKANAEAMPVGRVLATVNNEAVTLSDYKRYLMQIGSSSNTEAIDRNLLRKLIDDRIILMEAKKNGIFVTDAEVFQAAEEIKRNNNLSDEELIKSLAESGMAMTDYMLLLSENLVYLKFIDKELNSKIIVSDKEIADYYYNNINRFIDKPERMLVKAIFIKFTANPTLTEVTDLKIQSLKIVSRIKKGESFESMVDLYADEPFRSNKGFLGDFEKKELITDLDQALSALKEGDVSPPVWVKEGVYILKLLRRTKTTYIPLSLARDEISSLLFQQKRETKFNGWLKLLWEKSAVTIK